MKILAIECSSLAASAAVCDNDKIIGESFANVGLNHSRTLMPMVKNTLDTTETNINDIDVFAVTVGPGSFTGVRIGVAALKGLADAGNKKCFAVSSTQSIAYPLSFFDGIVCSVMDARCNQVYTALFEGGKRLCDDDAILIDELKTRLLKLNKNIILTGDGAQLCYDRLKNEVENLFICDSQLRFPKASSVCRIAFEAINSGKETVSAAELLPLYLRLPQAQRELNNKNKNLKGE